MKQIQTWNINKGKWTNSHIEKLSLGVHHIKIIEVEREPLDLGVFNLKEEEDGKNS